MDAQHVAHRPLAVAMLPDGRNVTISEVETRNPMPGHDEATHVAVDVSAGAGAPAVSYGFLSEKDALRFVTSWGEDDYKGYDANGRETVTTRHGLGCPDALISRRGKGRAGERASDKGEPRRVSSPNVSGSRATDGTQAPASQGKTEVSAGSEPGLVVPVTTAAGTNATESVDTNLPGLNDE